MSAPGPRPFYMKQKTTIGATAPRTVATNIKPPENAFLNEPYQKTNGTKQWTQNIKNYAANKSIPSQTRYNRLKKYLVNRGTRRQRNSSFNKNEKKKIQLNARMGNIRIEKYKEKNPSFNSLRADNKAGTVVIFADGKALYCVSEKGELGFPKGDIDYKLTDPADINTVYRETPDTAALRELKEETGFFIDNSLTPTSSVVAAPISVKLKREVNGIVDPVFYDISGIKFERETLSVNRNQINAYYYIIYLKQKSTDRGPDLSQLTPNAQREHIKSYAIVDQFDTKIKNSYNYFSRLKF